MNADDVCDFLTFLFLPKKVPFPGEGSIKSYLILSYNATVFNFSKAASLVTLDIYVKMV